MCQLYFLFYNGEFKILNRTGNSNPKSTGNSALVKNLYENVYKNEKKCFYYENIKFFIIFKKLSQHMIFWSTKSQHHPTYQNFCLLNHDGWVGELKHQFFPKDFIKI